MSAVLIPGVVVCLLAVGGLKADAAGSAVRVTPIYDPPVLAGQEASTTWPGWCSGGVYGRHGDQIVLTSSGHCSADGQTDYDAADGSVIGVFGPISEAATCAHPGYRCTASDMNYLIVAPDHIPWGHLNEVDMGVGGYRVIEPGTVPLECKDVHVGDEVEFDGRKIYRAGQVLWQSRYLPPVNLDPIYFPCITVADIHAATGDSGGIVLVNGQLAGIASRRSGDLLGFTPLGSGLGELGVTLCDTPDCGLTPP
jgi:hypothetical protein